MRRRKSAVVGATRDRVDTPGDETESRDEAGRFHGETGVDHPDAKGVDEACGLRTRGTGDNRFSRTGWTFQILNQIESESIPVSRETAPSFPDAEGGEDRTEHILNANRTGDCPQRVRRLAHMLGHELKT